MNFNLNKFLHEWIGTNVVSPFDLYLQIFYKVLLSAAIFYICRWILKKMMPWIIHSLERRTKNNFVQFAYKNKVFHALKDVLSLLITGFFVEFIFATYHPKTVHFLASFVFFLILFKLLLLLFRLLNSLEGFYYESQNYKGIAMVTVLQSIKLIGYIIVFIAGLVMLFNLDVKTVFATLGATTALLLLVFRDTILGIISGLHVALSKSIKVGDWIVIDKYKLEGNISEINLLTAKIINFDTTVSTIPTYDLITTEVKNYQVILDRNSRRLKRSIFFVISSFKFATDADIEKWKNLNLIADYLEKKSEEIKEERKNLANAENIINGRQLTNIGVFRTYVHAYLSQHPNVDKNNLIVVRQGEIVTQGLPLELYCFTNKGGLVDFEAIQSDIFDHVLTTSAYFDLTIVQAKV